MKRVMPIIIIIFCITIIITGKVHWNNKLAATAAKAQQEYNNDDTSVIKEETKKQPPKDKQQLLQYTKNLPEGIVAKIKASMKSGEPVHLVLMGSESTSTSSDAWPAIVTQNLKDTYGKNLFDVSVEELDGKNTKQVIDEELYKKVIPLHPDILLLEPFSINDNGTVRVEDSLVNIKKMIENIKAEVPEVTVVLQPSQPIFNAIHYPLEVNELKKFAQKEGYVYLDHWTNWPDFKNPEFKNYIVPDSYLPNKKGNKVWAEYISNFFISK